MSRSFLAVGFAACLLLAYVQQQVTLVSIGYQVERLRHAKDDLLDQHRVLHYNVLTLQSPVILDRRLGRLDVQMSPPQAVEVVSPQQVSPPAMEKPAGLLQMSFLQQVKDLTLRWLDGGQQAEARPVFEEKNRL